MTLIGSEFPLPFALVAPLPLSLFPTCCVTPSSVLFGLGAAYLTMQRVADSSASSLLSSPRLALTCNSCVDTVESQSFHSHPAASPPTIASVVAATSFALISVRSKDVNANSTSLAHIRCDTPLAMPGKTSMRSTARARAGAGAGAARGCSARLALVNATLH